MAGWRVAAGANWRMATGANWRVAAGANWRVVWLEGGLARDVNGRGGWLEGGVVGRGLELNGGGVGRISERHWRWTGMGTKACRGWGGGVAISEAGEEQTGGTRGGEVGSGWGW